MKPRQVRTKVKPKKPPQPVDYSETPLSRGVAVVRRRHRVPDTLAQVIDADVAHVEGSIASIFTERQIAVITAPPRDNEVNVLPTGEIYSPWDGVARRLTKAFGAGAWRMVARSEPMQKGNVVTQEWALWIGDFKVGENVWGWHDHYPNNPRTNWADAIEAAKSRAMTRLCKNISMFDNLLSNKDWCRLWRNQHCVAVITKERKRNQQGSYATRQFLRWRKKDADRLPGEVRPATELEVAQGTNEPIDGAENFQPAVAKDGPPPTTTAVAPRDTFAPPANPDEPQTFLHLQKGSDKKGALYKVTTEHTQGRAEYFFRETAFLPAVERLVAAKGTAQVEWKQQGPVFQLIALNPL